MLTSCRAALALSTSLLLAGCTTETTEVQPDRVYTLVGTLGAPRWTSADVPGSTETRQGTTLPAFLVCQSEEPDSEVKAAAVVDRGTLTLRADGTAKVELTSGTWYKAGGVTGGSGGPIAEFGRWTEAQPGTIQLNGFTTIAFSAPLQVTETGSALTTMTFECPGASGIASVAPQLVFSRVQ
jgi:hypothetical protein